MTPATALRLGRADLGAAVARHAGQELRRVGADLAPQRDADALVEVVTGLLARSTGPDDDPAGPAPDPAAADALAVVRDLLAERAERLIIVLVGTGLSDLPFYHVPYVLPVALWLLVAASTITVYQRFATVWRQSRALAAKSADPGQQETADV